MSVASCFTPPPPVLFLFVPLTRAPQCVCKSYVEWLQNSDYDWPPVCSLCREAVEESAGGGGGGDGFDGPLPVIRLGCFCLFHADCLAAHTDALPETTTPAGYACPDCTMPIVRVRLLCRSWSLIPVFDCGL